MPRSLVLGNGSILVGLDKHGFVRDIYFPYVGLENHVGGHFVHRIGVWVDGEFSWLSDPAWGAKVVCGCESFSGSLTAINEELGVSLQFTDLVYNERNIFLRKVRVKNMTSTPKEVRVFFCHEFEMYESHRGDTAYFDPINHVVIHYKGRRVFLLNTRVEGVPFDDYTTGVFNIEGKLGSHKDAEDGVLSKNPIEHGPTDSVLGNTLLLKGGEEKIIHYWMTVADSIREAHDLNTYVLKKGPDHLIRTTTDFWHAWVTKYEFSFYGLSTAAADLFRRSLFFVRAHVDAGGAIIASSDSDMFQGGKDTYSYMWPRDAAFAAQALDRAGDPNVARRFFEFCRDVVTDDGYFMHKYRPDKSLGSSWHPWFHNGKVQLPIQEDETALVLWSLWEHYERSRDLEFVESVYDALIERPAHFLLGFRDFKTGLPKPTYDLWEERLGIHTFTAASVYAGLMAAAKFAGLLGKTQAEHNYLHGAMEIRDAIMRHLYNAKTGSFYRMVTVEGGQVIPDETVDISSAYGVMRFGVLEANDPRLARAFGEAQKELMVQTEVGGLARYKGDKYYEVDPTLPGNPWIITTLWFADYQIKAAKTEKDLEVPRKIIEWATKYAAASGVLSEQLNPHTGAQISAAPLTWSHAQFVITVLNYLDRLEDFGICIACNPIR